jgi:Abnormal spindle-like microcephaly-assoc'd, ASPM-SPD-2-Hydin
MSVSWLRVLGLTIASAWLAGCSEAQKIDVGGTCVLNSDCKQPLVCTMEKCHEACHTSVDCALGQSCIMASDQSKVCQLPSETRCIYNGDCPTGLICATDQQCRNQCRGNADCIPGQTCTTTYTCAELNQIDPIGNLVGPDSGVRTSGGDSDAGRPDGCPMGGENCSCYPGDTCNMGLTCVSSLCVSSGADGVAGTGGSVSPVPDASADLPADLARLDTGVAVGGLTVDQPAVNFGSVDQGETASKTVTVTNTGMPVAVSPQVTGNGFFVQGTTCVTVPTNGSCTITVAFSPGIDTSGGVSGTLTVAAGTTVSLGAVVTRPGTFAASLSVLPATALVNQAVPFTVTVTASGPLSDLSCVAAGPDVAVDPVAENTTCAATPAAPVVQSCVYSFIFKVAKAGVATDKISCVSSGKVQDLPVSVNVLSPASLSISPSPAAFPGVVGSTSDPVTFVVRNNGTASSGAVTAALGGTGAAQFIIATNTCSGVLAGLATCTVAVAYKPTAAGTVTATLTATDATVGSTPATAALNGTAVSAAILAITGTQDLGSVTVGQGGTPSTFTFTNSGGAASDLVAIGVTDAQFTIGNDLCSGLALAAGTACTVTVIFTPASAGLKTTVLTARSGATVAAQKQIQGTGVVVRVAALSMSPPTLDFGTIGVSTTAGPHTFTVTNTGGTATGTLATTLLDNLTSGGASQFTYTTTCGPALAPGAACLVAVTFAPTTAGSASANFTVGDGTVSTLARTVLGIALGRPTGSLDCGSGTSSDRAGTKETFTDTVIGKTATVFCTVANDPNSSQDTGAIQIAVTGDFAVPAATNSCTASLLPGLSCNFALTFTPTAMGKRIGTVTVTTANQGARNQDLSGVGLGVVEIVEFQACSGTASLCFPTVSPGAASNLVDPEPFDFGQVTQTTTSTTMLTLAVYVRNAVGTLSVTKDFGIQESFVFGAVPGALGLDCSTVPSVTALQASLTTPVCYKIVQFNPQTRTVLNGMVTVSGAAGQTDSATMTGQGTGPLTIAPSPAIFSNVGVGTSSATVTLTVRNTGLLALGPMAFTKTGTNVAQFSVVNDLLTGATIAAGGSATIGVQFMPTALGAASATITVSGAFAGGVESQGVSLVGNGIAPP